MRISKVLFRLGIICSVCFLMPAIIYEILLILLLDFIPSILIQNKADSNIYWIAVERKLEEYDEIKNAIVVSSGDDMFNQLDTTVVIQLTDGSSFLLANVNLYRLTSDRIEIVAINDRILYGGIYDKNENLIAGTNTLRKIENLKSFVPDIKKGVLYVLRDKQNLYSCLDDIYQTGEDTRANTASNILKLKVNPFNTELRFYDDDCIFVRTVYNDRGLLKTCIKKTDFL